VPSHTAECRRSQCVRRQNTSIRVRG
jgi:hypothetical protein